MSGTVVEACSLSKRFGLSLASAAQQAVLGAVIVAVTALYGRDRAFGDRI
jgi:hypothetical protein